MPHIPLLFTLYIILISNHSPNTYSAIQSMIPFISQSLPCIKLDKIYIENKYTNDISYIEITELLNHIEELNTDITNNYSCLMKCHYIINKFGGKDKVTYLLAESVSKENINLKIIILTIMMKLLYTSDSKISYLCKEILPS